jgi:hypothetical protein
MALNTVMLNVVTECRYAKCRYAECRGPCGGWSSLMTVSYVIKMFMKLTTGLLNCWPRN